MTAVKVVAIASLGLNDMNSTFSMCMSLARMLEHTDHQEVMVAVSNYRT